MSPSIEGCPNEIIENIVVRLPLGDICSLRRSSRTLATKTTQCHFRSYFQSKHVDITGSALREFVILTQPGWLGCLVQKLTLVGVVNNLKLLECILKELAGSEEESGSEDESDSEAECGSEEEADPENEIMGKREGRRRAYQDLEILKQRRADYETLHESGNDVTLLSSAFRNILMNSPHGRLLSLSLEVVVYREDAETRIPPLARSGWTFIWQSAADTFHTAFRSLAASKLPIQKLNIFNDRRLQRCSLASDELGKIDFDDKGLALSLGSLKSLSLSISERIVFRSRRDAEDSYDQADERGWDLSGEERDDEDIRAEEADERNFIGLAKLLQLTSGLQELEIHRYWLGLCRPDSNLHLERILQRVATMETLPNLKVIELRGMSTTEEDLLKLLQRTGVRKLYMYNIHLASGTFRSIFDYCTHESAGMEKLYFHELAEMERAVYFDGPATGLFSPWVCHVPGGNAALEKTGAEVQQQISYRATYHHGVLGSFLTHYMQQTQNEYGPPTR
jgi:hypothetical protein